LMLSKRLSADLWFQRAIVAVNLLFTTLVDLSGDVLL
jgi:hypothetical protein